MESIMKKILLAAGFLLACQGMFAVENIAQNSPYYQKRITLIGYPPYPFTDHTNIFSSTADQRQSYRMKHFSYGAISQEMADSEMKKFKESGINMVVAEDNRYLMSGGGNLELKGFGLNSKKLDEIIENTNKVIKACHDNKMQFIHHITCTMIDSGAFKEHPEWQAIDMATGKFIINHFNNLRFISRYKF